MLNRLNEENDQSPGLAQLRAELLLKRLKSLLKGKLVEKAAKAVPRAEVQEIGPAQSAITFS
jgi:hypothetical protein